MHFPPDRLTALRAFGYTEAEARFLYLVAAHSGNSSNSLRREAAHGMRSRPKSSFVWVMPVRGDICSGILSFSFVRDKSTPPSENDLGCGRALSSIFLHREFEVEVWSVDLWFSSSENLQRIRDARVEESVHSIHADARALPFANDFFDAIISIDSVPYYGTDDLYLGYVLRFLKPSGQIAIAGAGLMHEIAGSVPERLASWWEPIMYCLYSASWWRSHWEKMELVNVELADAMPDGKTSLHRKTSQRFARSKAILESLWGTSVP